MQGEYVMIITHNMAALNSARQLGIVQKKISKNTEILSSGYRINRAADNAAGLSISEKMRKQIRGLKQGIANAEDGISLCQVADGALHEVTEMIHRISELATKSANGTNSFSDREAIQIEVSALITEIDRVSETTKFNEIYLFKGNTSLTHFDGTPTVDNRFFQLLGNNVSHTGYMCEPLTDTMVTKSTSWLDDSSLTPAPNPYVSVHIDFSAVANQLNDLSGTEFYVNCCTDCCPTTVKFTDSTTVSADINTSSTIEIGLKKADGTYYNNATDFCNYIVDSLEPILSQYNYHVQFAYQGSTLYLYDIDNASWDPSEKEAAYFCDMQPTSGTEIYAPNQSIYIQSGADVGDGIILNITAMDSTALGLVDIDVLTEENATNVINVTKEALRSVSTNRSRIGAQQNRLEHTVKNEENIVENTTASESQIRDTDMASSMVAFSMLSILRQTGQTMLAQANQSTQGVLTLLS